MYAPLKDTLRNFIAGIRYVWATLTKDLFCLNRRNWKWISAASLLVILLFVAGNMLFHLGSLNLWWMLIAGLIVAAFPIMYGGMIKTGLIIARRIPVHASWLLFSAGALFFINFSLPLKGRFILVFYILFTFIFIAGALSNILSQEWKQLHRRKRLWNIFFLCVGASNLIVATIFLVLPGREQASYTAADREVLHPVGQLALPDPSLPGAYSVGVLTYGAGSDKHRKEFGETASILSGTVDGSAFLGGWDRLPGRLRSAFWGFGPGELPLNGRVWMPEGEGPFPVILIVHGNHLDRDFSDSGYAYLAEHLASHGYLAVSVDENFLNHGLTDFNHSLEEENDARGWLLLKHLELLRSWNSDSTSDFFGKADTEQVILVGHSRGGEAVSIAACFNTLPCFPDDASEKFEFNFGIRGIVAIAPVDGQYTPGNRPTPLSDVNYLALQGSMDADLDSYMGLHQFNRIRFSDSDYYFKAGLYILNANHGQFNTSWGANDAGYPNGLLLNRRVLLGAEAQEQAALVCITAFVKAALDEERGYVQLFRDHRTGRDWLPETGYISQFADNRAYIIADFEEDVDLLTASMGDSAAIGFDGLAALFEEENELRKGTLGTKTAMIGWNNSDADTPGKYMILFDPPLDLKAHPFGAFQFDVAVLDRYPGERMNPEESPEGMNQEDIGDGHAPVLRNSSGAGNTPGPGGISENHLLANVPEDHGLNGDDTIQGNAANGSAWYETDDEEPGKTGFTILLTDQAGNTASVAVSEHYPLMVPVQIPLYKLKAFNFDAAPEPVPQHVEIDLQYFYSGNSGFDKEKLSSIQFVFDRAPDGMVSIDNIGFTQH